MDAWVRNNTDGGKEETALQATSTATPKNTQGAWKEQFFFKPLENLFHARPKKPKEHKQGAGRSQVVNYGRKTGMKQPKRLTRNQKELLKKRGMDPKDYMYHSESERNIVLWRKSERQLVGIAKMEV